jgi:hypothetical protein
MACAKEKMHGSGNIAERAGKSTVDFSGEAFL